MEGQIKRIFSRGTNIRRTMTIINLSPTRITDDALVVWQEAGPEVDVVMDLRALTFRPGSVDQIISYHVLDRMFFDDAVEAIKNWKDCLKKGGKLYIVTDDFEYIARAFVGGDINIDTFNRNHSHASQWDRQLLGNTVIAQGFPEPAVSLWYDNVPDVVDKKHFELIIEATK